MAMGLANAGQSFQRYLDSVLKDIDGIFVYLDDILLFSRNKADHVKKLHQVLERLNNANLTLSTSASLPSPLSSSSDF